MARSNEKTLTDVIEISPEMIEAGGKVIADLTGELSTTICELNAKKILFSILEAGHYRIFVI
jgi:hypothetical protein